MKFFLLLIASALYAQCEPAYLPSARRCIEPCDSNSDFYASLDFLYWEGTERGLEYALKNAAFFFQEQIQIYEPGFNFEPAFRIGIGSHLPHDNWDLEFTYTRFFNTTFDRAHHEFNSLQNSGIRSVWTSSIAFQNNSFLPLWQKASAKWKIHSHFLDLFLKHRLCMSSAITLEPALGLKLALLQQRFVVDYEDGNTAVTQPNLIPFQFLTSHIAMNNRSFNLGPTASLISRWNVFDHFDFLGTLSGSLLASHFDVGRNEFNQAFDTVNTVFVIDSIREGSEYWAIRPQTALSFGLSWSDCVCRPTSTVQYGFSASYEAQVWWKQNMLYRFIDQTSAAMIAPTQGNLFFHGLTLEGFVDF